MQTWGLAPAGKWTLIWAGRPSSERYANVMLLIHLNPPTNACLMSICSSAKRKLHLTTRLHLGVTTATQAIGVIFWSNIEVRQMRAYFAFDHSTNVSISCQTNTPLVRVTPFHVRYERAIMWKTSDITRQIRLNSNGAAQCRSVLRRLIEEIGLHRCFCGASHSLTYHLSVRIRITAVCTDDVVRQAGSRDPSKWSSVVRPEFASERHETWSRWTTCKHIRCSTPKYFPCFPSPI